MMNLGDRAKAITAEDLIRRYNLDGLKSDRKAISTINDGLTRTNANLENYVEAVTKNLEELQNQVDGNITTWFFNGVPSPYSPPANEWVTDEDKINHLGDLYYDQDTGYAYRWAMINDIFEWNKIVDADVVEALALANSAQDTADSKRRTFMEEPTTPYDSGDIWIHNGEIYRCIRSRADGDWNTADWVNDLIYTDDTIANKALNELENYKKEVQGTYVTNKVLEETTNSISSTIKSVYYEIDKKNTIFNEQPTTPYQVGDMYIKNEKVYICIAAKEEGDYDPNDWELNLDGGEFATKTQIEQTDKNVTILAESVNNIEKEAVITKQSTGNSITIEDAGPYDLESIAIDGKSVQDGTSTPDAPIKIQNVEGVTNLFNKNNLKQGYRLGNDGNYYQGTDYSATDYFIEVKPNTQYATSFKITTMTTICLYDSNFNFIRRLNTNASTFTTDSNEYYAKASVLTTEVDTTIINKGSITHPYVPYGRWLEVKSIGKNLFDINNITHQTLNQTDGFTPNNATAITLSNYIKVEPNETYKAQCTISDFIYRAFFYDKNKKYLGNNTFNTTMSYDAYYVRLQMNNDYANANFQLEKEVLTEYEPYKENTALVDMNKKNLKDNNPIILNGYMDGDGNITSNNAHRIVYVSCKPNTTYTIMKVSSARFAIGTGVEIKPGIGVLTSEKEDYNGGTKLQITSGENDNYIAVWYYNSNADTLTEQEIYNSIKIYEGIETDDYYSFKEDDTFKDGILTQKRIKVTYNGSENWFKSGGTTDTVFVGALSTIDLGIVEGVGNSLCTHFTYGGDAVKGTYQVYNGGNNIAFRFDINEVPDVEALKTWLSNNPVTIEYILKTPIEHNLNYEILELHKGYNNITTNDDLEPNMSIIYLTDSKLNAQYATKGELNILSNEVNLKVEAKIDDKDLTSAEIIARINADKESEAVINADKISLKGKEINLTTDNVIITSENSKINEDGSMEVTGGTQDKPNFKITSSDGEASTAIIPDAIIIKNNDGTNVFNQTDDFGYVETHAVKRYEKQISGFGGVYSEIASDGKYNLNVIDDEGNQLVIGTDTLKVNSVDILGALFYKPGDVYTPYRAMATNGFLTGSATNIFLSFVLPKSMVNVTPTVTSLKLTVRHPDGGYLLNAVEVFDDDTLSITETYKSNDNVLQLRIAKTTAFNFTNNVPLSISIDSITVEFS